MRVKIRAMEMANYIRRAESEVLATFTADIGGVQLAHCAVVRKPDGFMSALAPQGKVNSRSITFTDAALHAEFRERAVAMYKAMVGADAEPQEPVSAPAEEPDDAGMMRFLEVAA